MTHQMLPATPAARSTSAQVLPVGGATPAADCASRGPQVSYSLAAAVTKPPAPLGRGGRECVPAHIQGFVNTWIGKPEPRPVVVRDFTFKAVVGEPSW